MKSTPLLRLLIPLCVGIGVGDFAFSWLLPYEKSLYLLGGVVFLCSILALFRHTTGLWLTLFSSTLLFSLGLLLIVHQQRERITDYPQTAFTFRGVVTDVPHRTPRGWRICLRMQAPIVGEKWQVFLTDSTMLQECPSSLRPNDPVPPQKRPSAPQIGQIILAHGRVTALYSKEGRVKDRYSAYLLRQNIVATAHCFPNEWKTIGKGGTHTATISPDLTLHERLLRQRELWMEQYQHHLPPHSAAVLSAMTLAHRELLDRDTKMRYSQGGASHILALSGLHLSILFGAFTLVLGTIARRFGRTLHLLTMGLGLALMWSFAAFVGFPISLVRATLMLTLAQVFTWGNHRPGAWHGLVLSMTLMLCYAPDWLFDVGFQLSCAAVAGILLFAPIFPVPQGLLPLSKRAAELINRRPTSSPMRFLMGIGRYFYLLFVVSLSAQLATAPLVAYHFHQVAWGGLFSSLFVIPAAYLLLCGGMIFLLISPLRGVLSPWLTDLISLMEQGLAFFSKDCFAPIPLYPSALTTALSLFALLGLVRLLSPPPSQRLSIGRSTLLATGCLLLPMLSYQMDRYSTRPQAALYIYPTSGVTTLHATSPDGHSWLLASDTLRAQAALRQTAHEEWEPQDLTVEWIPMSVLNESTTYHQKKGSIVGHSSQPSGISASTTVPLFAPHCLIYGQQRIAIVDSPLSRAFPQHPLSVDVLLVGHDVHRPLSHLLTYYRPQVLVLSAAMTDFYRRQYLSDAARLRLPCYDLQQEPTFTLLFH